MEFFRQKYQNGLPFPPPWDLPDPGIEPTSPALQMALLPPLGKPLTTANWLLIQSYLNNPSYLHVLLHPGEDAV